MSTIQILLIQALLLKLTVIQLVNIVASLTRGALGPIPPPPHGDRGSTGRHPSLKMVGWRLKVGWSSLKGDSPRQSPGTNSSNNYYVVQWSNPVVETSAGEPVISMRPFAVSIQLKCDDTRGRTGGEVKGKLANGVGSQYSSQYFGTWRIRHYYRWRAHLGCQ
jgi:hypothetical protein